MPLSGKQQDKQRDSLYFPLPNFQMENTATAMAEENTAWTVWHDKDGEQWQVDDGGTVIATGIDTEKTARMMAAAPDLRRASQELYDRLQEYLDVSDDELIKQGHELLVEAMDKMEAAWHKADGMEGEKSQKRFRVLVCSAELREIIVDAENAEEARYQVEAMDSDEFADAAAAVADHSEWYVSNVVEFPREKDGQAA